MDLLLLTLYFLRERRLWDRNCQHSIITSIFLNGCVKSNQSTEDHLLITLFTQMKMKWMVLIRKSCQIPLTLVNGSNWLLFLNLVTLLILISHMTICNQVKLKLISELKYQEIRGYIHLTTLPPENHRSTCLHSKGVSSMNLEKK